MGASVTDPRDLSATGRSGRRATAEPAVRVGTSAAGRAGRTVPTTRRHGS